MDSCLKLGSSMCFKQESKEEEQGNYEFQVRIRRETQHYGEELQCVPKKAWTS